MANQGRIKIGLDFNVNTANIEQVKKQLRELQKITKNELEASGGSIAPIAPGKTKSWKNNLHEMKEEAKLLEQAIEAAYNPKLGTFELTKFNNELNTSTHSSQQTYEALMSMGEKGARALQSLNAEMFTTGHQFREINSGMKKLGETMFNTIRWSVTSTIINTVTGNIQKAFNYAVDLDKTLTDIRVVTSKSAEDMDKFARQANKAAKALGTSTTDYTEASLIYYQQGLNDKEVASRTETTLKAASITGQSAQAVSEQLTAVWNGYKVSAEESEKYIDKLSAVAATTAADLEELSTGMSRVASAANIMGVDIDQLNAQLGTIVSVTREAPESIGTALKTVYARMSDIEAGIDTETTLGEYTSQMAAMGVNVLDANGNLRDMGAVVEEIGNKWSSLNREQQVSLAQSIAGTRQYSRMMALFDNWDMYQDALNTSKNSLGALDRQHSIVLDSITGKQNKLRASAEGLYDSIFNSEDIKGFYELLSGATEGVDFLVQSLGGLPGILALVSGLTSKIVSQKTADLLVTTRLNRERQKYYREEVNSGLAEIEKQRKGEQAVTDRLTEDVAQKESVVTEARSKKEALEINLEQIKKKDGVTSEEIEEATRVLEKQSEILQEAEKELSIAKEKLETQEATTKELNEQLNLIEKIYKAQQRGSLSEEEWNKGQALISEAEELNKEKQEQTTENQNITNRLAEIDQAKKEYAKSLRGIGPGAANLTTPEGIAKVEERIAEAEEKLGDVNIDTLDKEIEASEAEIQQLQNKLDELEQKLNQSSIVTSENQQVLTQAQRQELQEEKKNIKKEKTNKKTKKEEKEKKKQKAEELKEAKEKIANVKALTKEEEKLKKQQEEITKETQKTTQAQSKLNREAELYGEGLDLKEKTEHWTNLGTTMLSVSLASIGLSTSIEGLVTDIQTGTVSVESFTGVLGSLASMTPIIVSSFKDLRAAQKAHKASMDVAKISADLMWASFTFGISVAISLLPAVINLVKSLINATNVRAEAALEDAEKIRAEKEANLALIDSYSELYKQYEESGKATEELKTSAEALIEKYNIENGELLLLTENYEELTEAIKKKREEEEKELLIQAKIQKDSAETLLNKNIKGVTDKKNSQGGYDIEFYGEKDGKNLELLRKAVESAGGNLDWEGNKLVISTPNSSSFAYLYNALSEAYSQMENTSSSKIAQNVKQIIDSSDYASASGSYIAGAELLAENQAKTAIKDHGSFNSFAEFEAHRDRLINTLMTDPEIGVSEEAAKNIVDTAYSTHGEDSFQLLARQQWFTKMSASGVSLNKSDLDLDNLENAVFNMLASLNAGDYNNNYSEMLRAAKVAAQKNFNKAWTEAGEVRLGKINSDLEKNEQEIEKSVGQSRIKNLENQIDLLQEKENLLAEISKENKIQYEDSRKEFEDLFKEKTGQDITELALNEQWADIQERINNLNEQGRYDDALELQGQLIALMTESNNLKEKEADLNDVRNEKYEEIIEKYNYELEYLDTVKEKYEGMINILSELNDLYQAIYGENEFSKLASNLNRNIDYSLKTYQQDLEKISKLEKILEDGYGIYIDDQGNEIKLNETNRGTFEKMLLEAYSSATTNATAYIEAIKAAIENSVSVAFETSFERAVGTQFGTGLVEWELTSEAADRYLDARERSYRISSLEMDTLSAMNKMSADAQEQMQEALDAQIDSLRKIEKLTEEDIERAERKLDIKRAEIALEEAYNNSTTMQLVRDARTGQWTYDYAVDQDAILKAEEEKRNAIQADREANEQALKDGLNRFLEIRSTLGEQLTRASSEEERKLYLDNAKTEMNAIVDLVQRLQGDLGDSELLNNTMVQYIMGLNETGIEKILSDVKETPDYTEQIGNILDQLENGIPVYFKEKPPAGGATGMYTGSWGSSGKLAILHEKEIVLNKEDTKNFLDALDIVRSLQLSMLNNVTSITPATLGSLRMIQDLPDREPIQQTVTIEADFSGVQNSKEIEEAFENIINLARQHAYSTLQS